VKNTIDDVGLRRFDSEVNQLKQQHASRICLTAATNDSDILGMAKEKRSFQEVKHQLLVDY